MKLFLHKKDRSIVNVTVSKINSFLFLSIFFFPTFLSSQTLLLNAEKAFENQLPFNSEYIAKNKIKSITFDILDKKDMQVAEDKGLLNYYEFNAQGLLTRFYYTSIVKVIQKEYHAEAVYHKRKKVRGGYSYTKNEYVYDTVSTVYFYNADSTLKMKRYNDGPFYESYYYDYYPNKEVQREKRFKETNVSPNKSEFILGAQFIISEESYLYQPTGKNQRKKIYQNDEGRPYKEAIYNTNDSNKILNYNEQYTATWIRQGAEFKYNSKNQLISATYTSNSNDNIVQKRTYEYDANDCLFTEKQYKNDELIKEISYVTDPLKKLHSYIIRDANSKSMRIVKLFYQYY